MDEREFRWTVPVDHPAFAGHFPGRPIVPGVVLLDQALRFAGQWLASDDGRWQIGNAKFLQPAGPGDALCFLLLRRADGGVAFRVRREGELQGDVASGSLSLNPAP